MHHVQINHAIVASRDKTKAADLFAHVFGLPAPTYWGPFATVLLGDGAHLHFAEPPHLPEIQPQHVAFRVDDARFDAIHGRIVAMAVPYWADPRRAQPNEINTLHGGRGFYFQDPTGHYFEVLTRSEVD